MPVSISGILFDVESLCTGLISALLSLAGYTHNCTLPLALGTRTKLLQHFNVSSTSRGTIICCSYSLYSSSFSGSWSA